MKMYVRKPSESPLSLISETLCKDVFRVKLFKPLFAQHLLQEALRHDALFQPSNLHISVTNQTDKEAKLAMKIGPNYWHCINSERVDGQCKVLYQLLNWQQYDNVSPVRPVHGKATIVKNSASGNEFLESELKVEEDTILFSRIAQL